MNRFFIAINLSEQVKRTLCSLRSSIKDARWQNEKQLHLTLQFIGQIDLQKYHKLCEWLDEISFHPFNLRIRDIGYFGSRKRPRIIWAAIEESKELIQLQKNVLKVLDDLDIEYERRKYRPHITLARLGKASLEDVLDFQQECSYYGPLEETVESFHLYSTELHPNGSIYTIEQSFKA